jgi:hypothetical protein
LKDNFGNFKTKKFDNRLKLKEVFITFFSIDLPLNKYLSLDFLGNIGRQQSHD